MCGGNPSTIATVLRPSSYLNDYGRTRYLNDSRHALGGGDITQANQLIDLALST
jgi:hypothetical protein